VTQKLQNKSLIVLYLMLNRHVGNRFSYYFYSCLRLRYHGHIKTADLQYIFYK